MRVTAVAAVAAALAPVVPLSAQDSVLQERPEGWVIRTDDASAGEEIFFVDMPPGWHITTGPGAIVYHPQMVAEAPYTVEMEVYLFDPGSRREAFGFFVGGQELDTPDQSYVYFMIREGGEYLVKSRNGADTETHTAWTADEAIHSWAARGQDEETAMNLIRLEVGTESVRFSVNGRELSVEETVGGPERLNGVVGLRVNHALNLHVSRFEILGGG